MSNASDSALSFTPLNFSLVNTLTLDQESAEEKLDLAGSADNFDIAFNVNYLKEVLGTINEDEISLVSFGSDKSALVESGDSNQVLVLMPLLL